MKISMFRAQILDVPEDDPLAPALENPHATRPIVILTLGTDDGIEGIGVSFYGGALTHTLKSEIDQLCELCGGETRCASKPSSGNCAMRRAAPGRAACSPSPWRRSTS